MRGVGIDLGTANTVVCHARGRVMLDEPSLMVMRASDRGRSSAKPALVGKEAQALIGRCPSSMAMVRPLRDGVITNLDEARAYIAAVLSKLHQRRHGPFRTRAVIGVPVGATDLERRALLEAASDAGIRHPRLVPEPIAGAVGCGLDPMQPNSHLVVDIGGGTSEVTAFCYGGGLVHRSCRVAGDEMTLALYEYLRGEHQLLAGEQTVEYVKCRVATEADPSLIAEGIDAATGRPRLVTLAVSEVVEALRPTVDTIIATLANCLDELPPQAASDVMAEGVWAFGGGVLMRGFEKLLEDAFAFPVRIAPRPLLCVAEGAAACLSRPEVLDAFDSDFSSAA
jgi:rod shape-determining protein MreB